mgnify:CR=1 FL=1
MMKKIWDFCKDKNLGRESKIRLFLFLNIICWCGIGAVLWLVVSRVTLDNMTWLSYSSDMQEYFLDGLAECLKWWIWEMNWYWINKKMWKFFSERLPEIWIRHTITDPCIDCKKQTMQGLFYERLYWRAGNRDCKLHYTREGNNPADSKKIRSVKIDCT